MHWDRVKLPSFAAFVLFVASAGLISAQPRPVTVTTTVTATPVPSSLPSTCQPVYDCSTTPKVFLTEPSVTGTLGGIEPNHPFSWSNFILSGVLELWCVRE